MVELCEACDRNVKSVEELTLLAFCESVMVEGVELHMTSGDARINVWAASAIDAFLAIHNLAFTTHRR